MTSYQKLKEENKMLKSKMHELLLDMEAVIKDPNGYRAQVARTKVEVFGSLREKE